MANVEIMYTTVEMNGITVEIICKETVEIKGIIVEIIYKTVEINPLFVKTTKF